MLEIRKYKAAIFDLDGVIVDTAKYHYLAWKSLAQELGFEFTVEHNERLKGVSRMRSLEILLEIGGVTLTQEARLEVAARKNSLYLEYIGKMDESEILAGAKESIASLRDKGIKVALGSASKNARAILSNLGIMELFDAVIDGNRVLNAKPDPEVFLLGAKELEVMPEECVVFEDSEAGILAARAGRMYAVGIGDPKILKEADTVISGLDKFDTYSLF